MTTQQKALLRAALLQILQGVSPAPMPARSLVYGAALAGFKLTAEQIDAELAYLEGKALIQSAAHDVSAGLKRFRITAQGTEYLEAEGLA